MATGMNDEHIKSMALSWGEAVHYNVSLIYTRDYTRDFTTEDDPRVTLYTSMRSKVRCSPSQQDVPWPRVSMWVVDDDILNPQNTRYPPVMTSESLALIVEENIECSSFLVIAWFRCLQPRIS